jgi:hypothetical protein
MQICGSTEKKIIRELKKIDEEIIECGYLAMAAWYPWRRSEVRKRSKQHTEISNEE